MKIETNEQMNRPQGPIGSLKEVPFRPVVHSSNRQPGSHDSPQSSAGVCKFEANLYSPIKIPSSVKPISEKEPKNNYSTFRKDFNPCLNERGSQHKPNEEPGTPKNEPDESNMVEMLMDEEGYLVDAEGNKILDDDGMPIKLSEEQIEGL